MRNAIEPGTSHRLGAALRRGGVNVSVYSADGTRLALLLFDTARGALRYG